MKTTKILSGVGILMLAAIGAFATKSTHRNNTYWYDSGNGPASVSVPFSCAPGGPGCLGTSGPSLGKQLYTASDLLNPLHS